MGVRAAATMQTSRGDAELLQSLRASATTHLTLVEVRELAAGALAALLAAEGQKN